MSIIHNYNFSQGHISKISFNEVDEDEVSRYQWYLIYKNKRHDLILKESGDRFYEFICDTYFCVYLDLGSNEISIFVDMTDQKGIYKYKLIRK